MSDAATEDLLDVDPESLSRDDVDFELVRDALVNGTGMVRDQAAEIMLTFADADPESVVPALPEIAVAIGSDHVNVTNKTISIALLLAEDHLDEIEPLVEPLVSCLYDEIPRTQTFAAKALQPVAEEHPEWLVAHVELLVSVVQSDLEDPTDGMPDDAFGSEELTDQFRSIAEEEQKQQFLARGVAANLLYEAVQSDPSAGREHIDELLAALDDADGTVTAAIVDTLATIGERDPIAIEGAVPALLDLVDHPSEQVQARAVKALGFSSDDRAVDPLRELADDGDTSEDLREMAAQTADWIEHETQN